MPKKTRDPDKNYKKNISNKRIYAEANIRRIDNQGINITRNFYSSCRKIDNTNVRKFIEINTQQTEKNKISGYIYPQDFMTLNHQGYIQNLHNVPTIYHWARHEKNKQIPTNINEIPRLTYSMSLPPIDYEDKSRLNTSKYFWLNIHSKYINEMFPDNSTH